MTRFPVAPLAVAVITFICTPHLGLAPQKVRELRPNGQPIVSRLLPDDEVVIIESVMPDGMPPPFGYKPTRESELKSLGSFEELAVIDEVKSQSFFVMEGTWLNTRVTARVRQTLRTGRLGTAPGGLIEFAHQGGELEVNRVIVRTAVGVYFENSKRYLVAVRFHPDLPAWQVVMMFELDSLGRPAGQEVAQRIDSRQPTPRREFGRSCGSAIQRRAVTDRNAGRQCVVLRVEHSILHVTQVGDHDRQETWQSDR